MAFQDLSSDSTTVSSITPVELSLILVLSATVSAVSSASGDLDNTARSFYGNSITQSSSVAELSVYSNHLSGDSFNYSGVAPEGVNLDLQQKLSGDSQTSSTSSGLITNHVSFHGESATKVSSSGQILQGRGTLGVCDIVNEIMWLWGISRSCSADKHLQDRAINDINASLQVLWSKAREVDYWSRSQLVVNFSTGQKFATLPDHIQNVVGNVSLDNGQPLIPLMTKGELDNYAIYYLGASSRTMLNDTPQAYYCQRENQSSYDPVKINLHVIPQPHEDMNVNIEVVSEAPRYTWSDYIKCTSVPIPHKYVESLLLPIVRYRAMSFYLFTKPERKEMIQAEYLEALSQLGINDPIQGKEEVDD